MMHPSETLRGANTERQDCQIWGIPKKHKMYAQPKKANKTMKYKMLVGFIKIIVFVLF